MISFQREPIVIAAGWELTAIARISVMKHAKNGMWLFAGDKRPIAVICRSENSEHIFDTNGHEIDAIELEELMTEQRKSSGGFH